MPDESTRLQLRFSIWGSRLEPEILTAETGVTPSRSFHVGERRGAAAKLVAGWEWWSEWGSDDRPLLDEFLRVVSPHVSVFQAHLVDDAWASFSVVGKVGGIVIATREEAERRRWDVNPDEPFKPFFEGDRVELYFSTEALKCLAAIGATIDTHIDVELSDDRAIWPARPSP